VDSVSPFFKGVEILPDGSVVRSGTNFSEKVKEAHDASKASIQSRISNLESGGVKGTGDVGEKASGLDVVEETVTYRRVQGGQGTKTSQDRIVVDSDGNIFINKKDKDLNISIDNGEHAKHFIENNRHGVQT
jgi:hypothetical protein